MGAKSERFLSKLNPFKLAKLIMTLGLKDLVDKRLPTVLTDSTRQGAAHFYFHVVTAYDILRHQGVEIGKRDYLSHVGSP